MNALSPRDATVPGGTSVSIGSGHPEPAIVGRGVAAEAAGSAWTSCRMRFARPAQGETLTIQDFPGGTLACLWSPGCSGEVTRQTCPDEAATLLCRRSGVTLDTSKANERRGKR